MSANPKWKRLYDLALAEKNSATLAKRIRAAETAMTAASQEMLNGAGSKQEFDELLEAMHELYEQRLRRGITFPEDR